LKKTRFTNVSRQKSSFCVRSAGVRNLGYKYP